MSVSVSDAVAQEIAAKVADHQGAVTLLRNQLDVAQQSLAEWQLIQADVSVPANPADVAGGLG